MSWAKKPEVRSVGFLPQSELRAVGAAIDPPPETDWTLVAVGAAVIATSILLFARVVR